MKAHHISSQFDFSWLHSQDLQSLLHALSQDQHEARVVGGAIRDTLLKRPPCHPDSHKTDIDIATTMLPELSLQQARALGYHAIPTGIEYGTITVISPQKNIYQVTTLREDVATDGRHATIRFTHDWQRDAQRRDFTMNAIYLTQSGELIDLVNGLADIHQHCVRFIGDPAQRIQEDYLRILRFFRFYAWYGKGRPEAQALRACATVKSQLTTLSAERTWSELKKIFAAPDPTRSLLWMRQSGILSTLLPESEKWGLDHFHSLMQFDLHEEQQSPAFRRILSILPPDETRLRALAQRLSFSRAERKRLLDWQNFTNMPLKMLQQKKSELLYYGISDGLIDALYIRLAIARSSEWFIAPPKQQEVSDLIDLINFFAQTPQRNFPLTSNDLFEQGLTQGAYFGQIYKKLENLWIQSQYQLTRTALLEELKKMLNAQKK